jgi:hypothetical protein
MPGEVNEVNCRLIRARDKEWFACEFIYRPPGLVPGDVQTGYAYPSVPRDAQDAEVKQGMMERAER